MNRPCYTLLEWGVILAAYAYEVLDEPIMSDYCFDCIAQIRSKNIKDYSESTGMWIHGAIAVTGHELLIELIDKYNKLGEGTAMRHIIPVQYVDKTE